MQRWCSKLRTLAALHSTTTTAEPFLHFQRLLHSCPNLLYKTFTVPLIQVRNLALKQRKRKLESRKPATLAWLFRRSNKERFRTMKDGRIRLWKAGKRHNALLKSKKSKHRLRQPGIVPLAYAKVMKKLNFST